MLNVAIGVGRAGGAPRPSGSYPAGTGPAETRSASGFAATTDTLVPAAARRGASRRLPGGLPFPEAALAGVPRCFPAPFERIRPLSRTRLRLLLVRALFFFLLVAFMVTWDKTLLFPPLACQLQPSFFKYLRLLACECYDQCSYVCSARLPVSLQVMGLCVVSDTDSC